MLPQAANRRLRYGRCPTTKSLILDVFIFIRYFEDKT